MISTIIFDVGNVLIDFDWDGFMLREFPGASRELIAKLDEDVWGSGRWDRLDAGDDPEEVMKSIVDYDPEHEAELQKIFRNVGGTLRKRASTPAWIGELRARGYRLLYLSNYSHYVMEANPEVLDFLPLLDGGVFSCDVKLIKPNPKIYECLATKYNLVPGECVFIDDLAKNVNAAREFGFHSIQFVTLEQAQRDLNKLLEEER
ncbi:MAG: HAD family phosphatase [Synergistaceae bacterium]|nr:HAD family phosphatase [Synergistaceae bacterium]